MSEPTNPRDCPLCAMTVAPRLPAPTRVTDPWPAFDRACQVYGHAVHQLITQARHRAQEARIDGRDNIASLLERIADACEQQAQEIARLHATAATRKAAQADALEWLENSLLIVEHERLVERLIELRHRLAAALGEKS